MYPRPLSERSAQIAFEADMGGQESLFLIKPERILAVFVAGQLDEVAICAVRPGDCPVNHGFPDFPTTMPLVDANAFDLQARAPFEGQMWNGGKLHTGDDLAILIGDDKTIIRITRDGIEGLDVSGINPLALGLTALPEDIVGEKSNDGGQVIPAHIAKDQAPR